MINQGATSITKISHMIVEKDLTVLKFYLKNIRIHMMQTEIGFRCDAFVAKVS